MLEEQMILHRAERDLRALGISINHAVLSLDDAEGRIVTHFIPDGAPHLAGPGCWCKPDESSDYVEHL